MRIVAPTCGAAVRAQVALEAHDVVAGGNDQNGIAVKSLAQAVEHRARAVRVRRPDDQLERHCLLLSSTVTSPILGRHGSGIT